MLQFLPDTEEWSLAGHMSTARGWHADFTINFEDVMSEMFAHMFDFTTVSKSINEVKTCVFLTSHLNLTLKELN